MTSYTHRDVQKVVEVVRQYVEQQNNSLKLLTNKNEHEIAVLPSWLLEKQKVQIFLFETTDEVVIEARPDHSLSKDSISAEICTTNARAYEFQHRLATMGIETRKPFRETFASMGGLETVYGESEFAVPERENVLYSGGGLELLLSHWTLEDAKKSAMDFWDKRHIPGLQNAGSYVRQVQQILEKLRGMVSGNDFGERPVHRYINSFRTLLLPTHRNCFYEHRIYSGNSYFDADFVLEHEVGRPALLIELESPKAKVLTKKGEWTAEVNHARNQIGDWVKAIDDDSRNRCEKFNFLAGPKERLVIIGRGLEKLDKLKESVRSDTTIWTYDLLIKEALDRQNKIYRSNCQLLGLKEQSPFKLSCTVRD